MKSITAFSHGAFIIFKKPGKQGVIIIVDTGSIRRWEYTKDEIERKLGELDSKLSFLKTIADSGIFEIE